MFAMRLRLKYESVMKLVKTSLKRSKTGRIQACMKMRRTDELKKDEGQIEDISSLVSLSNIRIWTRRETEKKKKRPGARMCTFDSSDTKFDTLFRVNIDPTIIDEEIAPSPIIGVINVESSGGRVSGYILIRWGWRRESGGERGKQTTRLQLVRQRAALKHAASAFPPGTS